ncbi:hypothetical protein; putative signal peptide [Frankia alni ACN14a]|uniref:Uncharacterized protein n=1 Tax=Frankia alni (strain DSM 45986 / CECT 9034 / ACN14a) TaxID=326424 RepID=Q0RP82_FRAAA|nr:hypothetical protein; putative signal peptide [Frankia alni ACN14a]
MRRCTGRQRFDILGAALVGRVVVPSGPAVSDSASHRFRCRWPAGLRGVGTPGRRARPASV